MNDDVQKSLKQLENTRLCLWASLFCTVACVITGVASFLFMKINFLFDIDIRPYAMLYAGAILILAAVFIFNFGLIRKRYICFRELHDNGNGVVIRLKSINSITGAKAVSTVNTDVEADDIYDHGLMRMCSYIKHKAKDNKIRSYYASTTMSVLVLIFLSLVALSQYSQEEYLNRLEYEGRIVLLTQVSEAFSDDNITVSYVNDDITGKMQINIEKEDHKLTYVIGITDDYKLNAIDISVHAYYSVASYSAKAIIDSMGEYFNVFDDSMFGDISYSMVAYEGRSDWITGITGCLIDSSNSYNNSLGIKLGNVSACERFEAKYAADRYTDYVAVDIKYYMSDITGREDKVNTWK